MISRRIRSAVSLLLAASVAAALTGCGGNLSELQTAYVPDSVLEAAVFEQGAAYIQGERSLEQALDEIEKKVSIYMAE